jgi:hypothetical protein
MWSRIAPSHDMLERDEEVKKTKQLMDDRHGNQRRKEMNRDTWRVSHKTNVAWAPTQLSVEPGLDVPFEFRVDEEEEDKRKMPAHASSSQVTDASLPHYMKVLPGYIDRHAVEPKLGRRGRQRKPTPTITEHTCFEGMQPMDIVFSIEKCCDQRPLEQQMSTRHDPLRYEINAQCAKEYLMSYCRQRGASQVRIEIIDSSPPIQSNSVERSNRKLRAKSAKKLGALEVQLRAMFPDGTSTTHIVWSKLTSGLWPTQFTPATTNNKSDQGSIGMRSAFRRQLDSAFPLQRVELKVEVSHFSYSKGTNLTSRTQDPIIGAECLFTPMLKPTSTSVTSHGDDDDAELLAMLGGGDNDASSSANTLVPAEARTIKGQTAGSGKCVALLWPGGWRLKVNGFDAFAGRQVGAPLQQQVVVEDARGGPGGANSTYTKSRGGYGASGDGDEDQSQCIQVRLESVGAAEEKAEAQRQVAARKLVLASEKSARGQEEQAGQEEPEGGHEKQEGGRGGAGEERPMVPSMVPSMGPSVDMLSGEGGFLLAAGGEEEEKGEEQPAEQPVSAPPPRATPTKRSAGKPSSSPPSSSPPSPSAPSPTSPPAQEEEEEEDFEESGAFDDGEDDQDFLQSCMEGGEDGE